jgi:hypothetical protein
MDQIPMKNQVFRPSNTQSGSIFVWIFVMIALFAAFSFAVSQSSRTGAGSITQEKAKLAATEIIQFSTQLKSVIDAMRIDGCTVKQITFDGAAGGNYTNVDEPPDGHCSIFKSGGKMNLPTFGDGKGNDRLVFVGNRVEAEGGLAFMGTSEPELTMVREVDAETCGAINDLLSNPTNFWDGDSGEKFKMWESAGSHNGHRDQMTDNFNIFVPYDGDFSSTGGNGIRFRDGMTFNGASYAGRVPPQSGCFCDSSSNCGAPVKYYYYKVLVIQ